MGGGGSIIPTRGPQTRTQVVRKRKIKALPNVVMGQTLAGPSLGGMIQ